jgi:hypothetical protein
MDPLFEAVALSYFKKLKGINVEQLSGFNHNSFPQIASSLCLKVTSTGKMLELRCPVKRPVVTRVEDIREEHKVRALINMEVAGIDFCEYFECKISVFESKAAFYSSSSSKKGAALHFRDDKGSGTDVFDIWLMSSYESAGEVKSERTSKESVPGSDREEHVVSAQLEEAAWTISTIEDRLKTIT